MQATTVVLLSLLAVVLSGFAAHRIAHNQAHMEIAQQLKAIRVVFSEDGNCVRAIEGIDRIHQTLQAHFTDYDQQLEAYLLEAAPAPQP